MKTIIAGSRDITYQFAVKDAVRQSGFMVTSVVCGGARGVDTLGANWAKENKIDICYFWPDWSLGKRAGFIRNQEMADYAEALIAIWDGKSCGTKDMIDRATKKGLKVYIHRI